MDGTITTSDTTTTSTGSNAAAVAEAPSAPPTSAPSPTTDRPSIREALDVFNEAARAQGKRTRGRPTAPITPYEEAAPTAVAAATTEEETGPVNAGPIPFDRHQRILDNTRTKTRTETEQRIRQEYGNRDPAAVRVLGDWAQRLVTDPRGFYAQVLNEGLADPVLAPEIASLAAYALRGRQIPTGATSTEAPPPDFTDGNGNQFYSARAQQARDQWLIQQTRDQVLAEIQPLQEQVESVTEREAVREQQAALSQWKTTTLADVRKLPFFEAHEPAIKAAYAAMPPTSGHPAEEAAALRRAYDEVVGPKLEQLYWDKLSTNWKQRANAGSFNPGAAGPGRAPKSALAKDGGTWRDAFAIADAQLRGR